MATKYAIITGSSRGIGASLCSVFLNEGYYVIAIARSNFIKHPNYFFIEADLSDPTQLKGIEFPKIENAERVILINNAATLGEIGFCGLYNLEGVTNLHYLNTIAPIHLTNLFISQYNDLEAKRIIMNISSGAAQNPVLGWGNYCSSKAAINMFSEVVSREQEHAGSNIKVFALAPGIVDTDMQKQIRSSKSDDFPRVEEFLNYKNNGELSDPELVSRKIFDILLQADNIPQTVISVRDF